MECLGKIAVDLDGDFLSQGTQLLAQLAIELEAGPHGRRQTKIPVLSRGSSDLSGIAGIHPPLSNPRQYGYLLLKAVSKTILLHL
jgi:hypothetical protein